MTPLNFALKDAVKSVMPKVHPKKDYVAFAAVNVGSGFLAGLLALPVFCAVSWPVLRAKADLRPDATRLTAFQHLRHMWATPGPTLSLIARVMPLAALGIPLFRGIYFGVNDTLRAYNPYQKAGGAVGLFSKFFVAQVASLSVLGGAASAPKPPFTHHPQRQRRAIQREGARTGLDESRSRGVSVAPVQRVSSQAVTASYPMSVVIDRYVVANYEASAGIAHVAPRRPWRARASRASSAATPRRCPRTSAPRSSSSSTARSRAPRSGGSLIARSTNALSRPGAAGPAAPLTVRGTQTLVSFAPLASKLFCAARQNAVLRRSHFYQV